MVVKPSATKVYKWLIICDIHLIMQTVLCPSFTGPNNGNVSCALGDDGAPSFGDVCLITCNTGYELTGNSKRICQSNGSWSGNNSCIIGKVFQPPMPHCLMTLIIIAESIEDEGQINSSKYNTKVACTGNYIRLDLTYQNILVKTEIIYQVQTR